MSNMILDLFLKCGFGCAEIKEDSDYMNDSKLRKDELTQELTHEQVKKLNSIIWNNQMHWEDAYLDLCGNAILFGVKLGMEIQGFIDEIDN